MPIGSPTSAPGRSSAYGLALHSGVFPPGRLNPADGGEQPWMLTLRESANLASGVSNVVLATSDVNSREAYLDGTVADVPLANARFRIDLSARAAVLTYDGQWDAERLVHPYLAALGTVASHWAGSLPLHAGAVVIDGQAWGVLAERSHGKSTTMAALDRAGYAVLTDDLLVVDSALQAHTGPRCIDLRPRSAAYFPDAVHLADFPGRDRYRLAAGPAPLRAPLAGFVRLGWSEDTGLSPVRPEDRLPLLASSLGIRRLRPNMHLLMELATLPMVLLHRPKQIEALDASVDAMRSLADYS
jgi:hypothetical protein